LQEFAEWLSTTAPSVFIQTHYAWLIPLIQSVHITGIAMALGSVFLIDLRILGWAGTDQSLRQTANRFGPWLTGSLWLLLATGLLLVIGEPKRELLTFSFWAKMCLVAAGTVIAVAFLRSLRKRELEWEQTLARRASVKFLAAVTFLIWVSIIFLGRLIAYDHIWGSWSPGAA
jgi:hypothetical protein